MSRHPVLWSPAWLFKFSLALSALFVGSALLAQTFSAADLQRAQHLQQQESWADLGRQTAAVDQTECAASDTTCLHLMVIRSEYLFASRKFDAAQALLNKLLTLRTPTASNDDWEFIEQMATLARGVGERHAGQLQRAHATLSGLLTRPLREPVRVRALGEMAYVKVQRRDYDLARKLYEEQIVAAKSVQAEDAELYGRVGLALIAKDRAEYQSALSQFLSLVQRMEPPGQAPTYPRRLGFVHANLGAIYKQLGQLPLAMQHYVHARDLVRQVDAQIYKADYGDMIASAHRLMGNHEEALRVLNEEYFPFVSQPSRLYVAYREMALNLAAKKQWGPAAAQLQKAIDIRLKTGNVRHIGDYFSDLGSIELGNGAIDSALNQFTQGLAWSVQQSDSESQQNIDPESLWKNSFGLFQAKRASSDEASAIFWGKKAINILQQLRSNLSNADDFTRSTYLRHIEYVYKEVAALLVDQGRNVEAEEILILLKQRELDEAVRGGNHSKQEIRYVGSERLAFEKQTEIEATGVRGAQELALLDKRYSDGYELTANEQAQRQTLRDASIAWRKQYEDWLGNLSKLLKQSGRSGELTLVNDRATQLRRAVRNDPESALGVHYVVLENRIAIIVTTATVEFGRSITVSRLELARQVDALRRDITNKADTRPAAQALWRMLIAPILPDLQAAQAKTLIVSLTDVLRYLPFAALQNKDGRYLIEDYAIANWAAAAPLSTVSGKPWRVAALGVSEGFLNFSPLYAVRDELQGIVKTTGNDQGVLPGFIALNAQFTRDRLDEATRKPNNVIHIASHFDFKPGAKESSQLLLGNGSSLNLAQIAAMDFSSIEQLTLSACNTATGGGTIENGYEVESLATAVQNAGAKSVLASLWKVSDASTAVLMRSFYAQRAWPAPQGRAQALRKAQLSILHWDTDSTLPSPAQVTRVLNDADAQLREGDGLTKTVPMDINAETLRSKLGKKDFQSLPKVDWSHPYYWAPFILSGSWL
jgi:CHAT domain-containing protein